MAKSQDVRNRVDIIIPTYDNQRQLFQCVESMLCYQFEYPLRIIVVNNGKSILSLPFSDNIIVINSDQNLGWTGGLRKGLELSDSKYVMFANDDIFIPKSSMRWLRDMVRNLDIYDDIGAVGPASNTVMGAQNIWYPKLFSTGYTSFLVGFCVLVRREALEKSGGIHDMQFGGDDLDLSMRIRKSGYSLIIDKDVFIYHHGFQTGEKVYGKPDTPGGWNSRDMTDNTNMELIRKHGFMMFHNTILNRLTDDSINQAVAERNSHTDEEALAIIGHVNGGNVVELGCGARKTVSRSIGVDITPKGELCPYSTHFSVADIVADVEEPLPFEKGFASTVIARHILEHCIDVPKTLMQWKEIIEPNGKLIIACPNEKLVDGVPLNAQHKHAFTADSIKTLSELIGLKEVARNEIINGVSFVSVLRKEV